MEFEGFIYSNKNRWRKRFRCIDKNKHSKRFYIQTTQLKNWRNLRGGTKLAKIKRFNETK